MSEERRSFTAALRSWPLFAAALAFVIGGIVLAGKTQYPQLGLVVITLGAVCVGAWIALLASHNYSGHDDTKPPPA